MQLCGLCKTLNVDVLSDAVIVLSEIFESLHGVVVAFLSSLRVTQCVHPHPYMYT